MNGLSTIMDPEDNNSPGDLLQALSFNSKTDKFQYRRNVRIWYEHVLCCAEAGHNKAKGVAASLGRSLYARMDSRYKRIIDSAVDTEKLSFRNEDGSTLTEVEHIRSLESILGIVAKDSVTDRVRRLVRMSKDVYNRKRVKGETFSEYAARFQSLANTYIPYANGSTTSQDEQTFAMILIENAGLDVTTYNNNINSIISSTNTEEIIPSSQVQNRQLRAVRNHAVSCRRIIEKMSGNTADNENHVEASERPTLNEFNEKLIAEIDSIHIPSDDSAIREKMRFCISLDKALQTLQDIRTPEEQQTSTHAKPRNDNADDTTITVPRKIGTMLAGSRADDEKSRNRFYAQMRWFRKPQSRYHNNKSSRGYDVHHKDRRSYQHDDSEGEGYSSDEGHTGNTKTKRVFKRLGKRRDYPHGNHDDTRDRWHKNHCAMDDDTYEDDANIKPYFRKQVWRRSSRT